MSDEKFSVKRKFSELCKRPKILFPKLKQRWQTSKKKGVYIIYDSSDKVVHVGSTPRGDAGIHGRMIQHLRGKSSFVAKKFKGNGNLLRNGYKVSFIELENPRLRILLECYAIGILCPEHIGTG